jgi:hypothetical protein
MAGPSPQQCREFSTANGARESGLGSIAKICNDRSLAMLGYHAENAP